MLGAIAKSKASSSTKLRKHPKLGNSKNKIVRKVKAAKKMIKKWSETAGIKKRGFT